MAKLEKREIEAYLRRDRELRKNIRLESLLKFQPEGGYIEFCGRRAILLHADDFGVLRRELIETLGREVAKVIFTRYGFSCGQADAEALDQGSRGGDAAEFVLTGPRLHMFSGIAKVFPEGVEIDAETGHYHMSGRWEGSYEAEQHLRLYGPDRESVCWTLAGYASGFASVVFETDMICVEHRCQGSGHEACCWSLMAAQDCGAQQDDVRQYFQPLNLSEKINLLEQRVRERTRELEASEQRYRDLVKNLPDIAFNLDSAGRLEHLNSSGRARLGLEGRDLGSLTLLDLLPSHQHRHFTRFFRQLTLERRTSKLDIAFTGALGEELSVQLLIKPVTVHGNIVGFQGLAVDAAAQKARERRLAEYASRLEHREEQIIDLISDGLYTTDIHKRITLINTKMARWLRVAPDEAIGQGFEAFIPADAADCIEVHLQRCLSRQADGAFEVRLPGDEGEERLMEVTHEPLIENSVLVGVVGVVRDITVRRELENRLAQASRLTALGEFASGIAHEINNPIGLISGYAEEVIELLEDLQQSCDEASASPQMVMLKKGLETIQDQAYRCKYITGNLLSFARRQQVAPERIQLEALIRERVQFFVEGLRGGEIEVAMNFPASMPKVKTDPNLYSQILLNLLKNAADAMEGRGRILVSLVVQAQEAVLQVSDEGPGIRAEIIDQIFDPFFTTKGPSRGTGLGLSICYGIAKELQGRICCGNRKNGGAWFRVAIAME